MGTLLLLLLLLLLLTHVTCLTTPYNDLISFLSAAACVWLATGQLADTPTRGLPTRGLDDSRTGHLADWSTRGLDNSRTGQVADWTTRGCHRRLCVLSFPFWQHLRDRELSSSRLVQSAS